MNSRLIAALALCLALVVIGSWQVIAATGSNGDVAAMDSPLLDAFIKFDGVEGEVMHEDYKGWCDLRALSQSIEGPERIVGRSRASIGEAQLSDIMILKRLDKASPKLAEACCDGKTFASVQIEFTKVLETLQVFYRYELKNAFISHYRIDMGNGVEAGSEEVALGFESITVSYTPFDASGNPQGKVEYTWDVTAQRR